MYSTKQYATNKKDVIFLNEVDKFELNLLFSHPCKKLRSLLKKYTYSNTRKVDLNIFSHSIYS